MEVSQVTVQLYNKSLSNSGIDNIYTVLHILSVCVFCVTGCNCDVYNKELNVDRETARRGVKSNQIKFIFQ